MQGTNFEKVRRLIGGLLRTPQYTVNYLLTNSLRKTPLELEIPWFSYAAIDFLKSVLRRDMTVFEYGSGGSTLFFAKRSLRVTSTEDNLDWLKKVERRVQQGDLQNVTLQYREFDRKNPSHFASSDYLHSIPSSQFDVIVVDGTEEYIGQAGKPLVRPMCFYHAEKYVNRGGMIVVDDSWCYGELRHTNRAKEYCVFQSVGPCRPGITSTDIFFY